MTGSMLATAAMTSATMPPSLIAGIVCRFTKLGYHLVSDGGTRPVRVHVREPSFVNLQTMPR